MISNVKRGMFYSPVDAVSDRFISLIQFCWRRGIRLMVTGWSRWGTFRDEEDGTICIIVQPCEIETDLDLGFLLFVHEVGHALVGIPWGFVERSRQWFWRGTLLGLAIIFPDEITAWVAGFFLLRSLGMPVPRDYFSTALADFRAYFTIWRRARAVQGVWCPD